MSIDDGSPGIPAAIVPASGEDGEDGPIDRASSGGAEGTGSDGPGLAGQAVPRLFSSEDDEGGGTPDADPPR